MRQIDFKQSVELIANRNTGRIIYCDEWVGTFGQWQPLLSQVVNTSNIDILGDIEPVKFNHPDIYTFYVELDVDKPHSDSKERKEFVLARDESNKETKFGAIIELY